MFIKVPRADASPKERLGHKDGCRADPVGSVAVRTSWWCMIHCPWSALRRALFSVHSLPRSARLLDTELRSFFRGGRLYGEPRGLALPAWRQVHLTAKQGERQALSWRAGATAHREHAMVDKVSGPLWRTLPSTTTEQRLVERSLQRWNDRLGLSISTKSGSASDLPPPPPLRSGATAGLRVHKQRKAKSRLGAPGEPSRLCAAYCLASGYRLEDLRDLLRSSSLVTQVDASTLSRDVLHCRVRATNRSEPSIGSPSDGHVFFFESGATVFWDVDEDTQRELLRLARRCDVQPGYVSNVAFEDFDHEFEFAYLMNSAQATDPTITKRASSANQHVQMSVAVSGTTAVAYNASGMDASSAAAVTRDASDSRASAMSFSRSGERPANTSTQFRNDRIFLHDYADALSMLAISFGLAQSVKLLVFELGIDRLVEETRRLPEELAKYGRFRTVAQDDLRRRIGQLLTAKYSVALLSDILDTPDIFWEYPSGETVYNQSVQVVDLQKRARLLDKRMDIVQDSLALLNSELATSTTHRVEQAIVALIAIELGLQVFNKLF